MFNKAAVVVDEKEFGGRCLEATQDIKAGEIIFKEDALITGPSGESHFPICLACYRLITGDIHICNNCKWSLCSENCEKNPIHAKYECRVFKNNEVKPNKDPQYYFYITVLRCLMMQGMNPKLWEDIISLHPDTGKKKVVPPVNVGEFIFKKCDKKEYELDAVGRASTVVALFAFATTDRLTMSSLPRMASLIFKTAGMMSHSCVPNSSWVRIENADNTFSIKVWASVDIKKGEKITTQYLDLSRPQVERRFHLHEAYNYTCSCKRCADPTELGTYYGAVKCTKCPEGKGFMLSTEPLQFSEAVWKCDTCDNEQQYRDCVVSVETEVFEEVEKCETEEDFEQVLEKHAGKSLHPNHWLMMDCRQEAVKRMYGFIATIKPEEEMIERAKKMLEYCKALKIITDAFQPGHNRMNARLQLYTQYAAALTKGDSDEVDAEIEKICEAVRKGEEMKIFQEENLDSRGL